LAAAATEPSAPAAPPVKLICKRIEDDSTGSRLGKSKRICRTSAEWRALDDETYRALQNTKNKGLIDLNSLPKPR